MRFAALVFSVWAWIFIARTGDFDFVELLLYVGTIFPFACLFVAIYGRACGQSSTDNASSSCVVIDETCIGIESVFVQNQTQAESFDEEYTAIV